jgi:septation ring formation regulator EzrA
MKKCILGATGIMVIAGLLFGGKMIPYAQTAYDKASRSIEQQVPISFQIDAAKKQLENIGPEIDDMNLQIAKEKVSIKKLQQSIERQEESLQKSRGEMLTLRSHIDSGDEFYVAANSKAYTTQRVKEELRTRLAIHKTATATMEKDEKVLELREKSLNAAMERLAEARSQKTELALQIEHLTAQNRMNEVVKTASKLDQFDNSQLSRTRSMIEDISARLETEQEMMSMMPTHYGQIPVSSDSSIADSDVLEDMDAFFDQQDAKKSESKKEASSEELVSFES